MSNKDKCLSNYLIWMGDRRDGADFPNLAVCVRTATPFMKPKIRLARIGLTGDRLDMSQYEGAAFLFMQNILLEGLVLGTFANDTVTIANLLGMFYISPIHINRGPMVRVCSTLVGEQSQLVNDVTYREMSVANIGQYHGRSMLSVNLVDLNHSAYTGLENRRIDH